MSEEPGEDPDLQELARVLGRDIVVLVLAEAARIRAELESTHFDLRVHFHRGKRASAEFKQVRVLNLPGLTGPPREDQTPD